MCSTEVKRMQHKCNISVWMHAWTGTPWGVHMTDKEFKRLKRSELIEIIYEYQKREQALQSRVEALQAQLDEKNLKIQQAGSIAEATAALTGIFEATQKTADAYLEHIRAANPPPELEKKADTT